MLLLVLLLLLLLLLLVLLLRMMISLVLHASRRRPAPPARCWRLIGKETIGGYHDHAFPSHTPPPNKHTDTRSGHR
uniref:Putative secreted peptide n=1 Tax=Anopheles braziliensis TaxID=58242 RepID=A0A2M3ZMI8_9DIPT